MSRVNVNFIMPFLLFFPMISRWILPSGIESLLIVEYKFYSLYLPDLTLLIYLYLQRRFGSINKDLFNLSFEKKFKLIAFLLIGYAFIIGVANNNSEIILPITSCFSWLYLTIIFVFFPLSKEQIEISKYIMIPTLLFLCVEILLYSLGIIQYTSSSGKELEAQEYADIYRISTTIGAATGSALIIMILGIVCTTRYKIPKWLKFTIYIITSVSILFTISRGAILTWTLYLILAFAIYFFSNGFTLKKYLFLFFLAGLLIEFNHLGVFEPLVQRTAQLSYDNQVESGRDVLRKKTMNIISESYYMGVGLGQVFPDKDVLNRIHSSHKTAPHNSYLIIFAELGFVGLVLFLFMLIMMSLYLDYSKAAFWAWVFLLLVNFNTEGVLLHSEFWSAVLFFYLNLEKKYENTLYLHA